MRRRFLAVTAALTLGLVAPARAEPPAQGSGSAQPSAKDVRQAKAHYNRALQHYKAGEYHKAIDELNAAFELDPSGKDLAYNLGLVHEKLGEVDEAIKWFKRAHELETDEAERVKLETTIQRLEGARDELAAKQRAAAAPPHAPAEASPTPTPTPAPVEADQPHGRLDGLVIGTLALSGVAAVVGTIFGVRALATEPGDKATDESTSAQSLQDDTERAHSYAVVADIAFAVALVSGGSAAALYFGRRREPESVAVRPALGVGKDGVALSLGVKF